jgi:hypothetical protein
MSLTIHASSQYLKTKIHVLAEASKPLRFHHCWNKDDPSKSLMLLQVSITKLLKGYIIVGTRTIPLRVSCCFRCPHSFTKLLKGYIIVGTRTIPLGVSCCFRCPFHYQVAQGLLRLQLGVVPALYTTKINIKVVCLI